MPLRLEPARVRVVGQAEEGRLVFEDDVLVAVLTLLSAQHERMAGMWFLEHGFGPLDGPSHPSFNNLEAAQRWIEGRLSSSR